MYEPYEDKGKFKINLNDIKNKLIEKTRNAKQSKWFLVLIAIALVGTVGAYSGYVTYTAKIGETNSKITILERQLAACQGNVTSCLTDLQSTESELNDCQKSKEDCNTQLQNKKSELDTCNSKKQELEGQVQTLETSVSDWQSKYDALDQNFKILQTEIDQMECNFAKKVCGFMGLNYYYVKGDMSIVCCLNTEPSSCIPPTSDMTVKEISC